MTSLMVCPLRWRHPRPCSVAPCGSAPTSRACARAGPSAAGRWRWPACGSSPAPCSCSRSAAPSAKAVPSVAMANPWPAHRRMCHHVEAAGSGDRHCPTPPVTPPGEKKETTTMTNEAKVTHDAYVSIGCDELFYVACDGCPDTIFGPTDNEFEANGKALDHERNPPSKPPPALSQQHSASDPLVIPPTRSGAAWSVGQWESEPPQMQVA